MEGEEEEKTWGNKMAVSEESLTEERERERGREREREGERERGTCAGCQNERCASLLVTVFDICSVRYQQLNQLIVSTYT